MSIQRNSTKVALAATLMGSLLLVACGGDSSSDNTANPTSVPTVAPTTAPTVAPTAVPTAVPTTEPTAVPTAVPTAEPTAAPTTVPTAAPGGTSINWLPTYSELSTLVASDPASGANASFNATTAPALVGGINFYSKGLGNLRLFNEGTAYAVNYNGSSVSTTTALTEGSSIGIVYNTNLSRYISVPYTATTSEVTLVVEYSNSTTGTITSGQVGGKAYGAAEIVITDKNGKIIKVANACPNDGTTALADKVTTTVKLTDATNTEFFVLFNRATDGTGGLRVWSVKLN